ncbi:hypothetical protein MASR2M15_07620 [Anaerolineales bacterium]
MSDKEQQELTRVQLKYIDELMEKAHVQGVAIGLIKKDGEFTGEKGIVVMVDEKVPLDELDEKDIIPQELEGIQVDVQEFGKFSAGLDALSTNFEL